MKTPSGKAATIIDVYPSEREALIRWDESGEFARFKFGWLTVPAATG